MTAFDRADEFVERCSKFQLWAAVLGQFQAQLGSTARRLAAPTTGVRVGRAQALGARARAFPRLAPGLLGMRPPLLNRAPNCQYSAAQQGQNDQSGGDSSRAAQVVLASCYFGPLSAARHALQPLLLRLRG